MPQKKHITWRKATKEELDNGSPEMVIESIEEIEVNEQVEDKLLIEKIDFSKLSSEQLSAISAALKGYL